VLSTVKKLYGVRSKAVHGDDISEERLRRLDGFFVAARTASCVIIRGAHTRRSYEQAISHRTRLTGAASNWLCFGLLFSD